MNKIINLIKLTFFEWVDHKPLLMAAALSFYILLATGPILSIMVASIGSIYGEKHTRSEIVKNVEKTISPKAAETVKFVILKAYKKPTKIMSIISSITLLLFGGTMVFYQTRRTLNTIWEVDDDRDDEKNEGILKKLKYYGFSIIMLLIVGVLFSILMIKEPIINSIENFTDTVIKMPAITFQILNFSFSFLLITILFAFIYKILPDAEILWSDVWIGAIVTSFLFTIVQFLVGMNAENITSSFGAIGAITLIFIWLFYSSIVFLFGAIFTKVYAKKYGSFVEKN